ncbi:MAG: hemolysin III family protein [Anaeroplasmataceae bacterium]|nr:hemolysin III family protein [Anaeroplasmataceae bacterium]
MEETKEQLELEKKNLKLNKKYEKLEAKEEHKKIKAEIKQEEDIRLEPKRRKIRQLNEPPKRPVLEEIGNAVTHGVGAILAIVGTVFMLLKSDTGLKIAASIVYGFSMFFMMLMSCLYHSFRGGSKVKRLWRRFDYTSIYLLIGGTFAPLYLVYWGNTLGIVLFIIQWVLIATGVTFVCIFGPGRIKWLHYTLYFAIGWSGLIFIPDWIQNNLNLLWMILGGGVVYTLGMIPFAKRNVKSAHFIWHFFVLCGAIVHFLGILLFVY